VVEHLPSKFEALNSNPSTVKGKENIMESTKPCLKKWGEGKREYKYSRGNDFVQTVLYTCMELSQ
jgi:hypothetical protein